MTTLLPPMTESTEAGKSACYWGRVARTGPGWGTSDPLIR